LLDFFTRFASADGLPRPPSPDELEISYPGHSVISVDWNIVLREVNAWCDRIATAARVPNVQQRATALRQIESEIGQMGDQAASTKGWWLAAIDRQRRSKQIADLLLSQLLPTFTGLQDMEDRANTDFELIRTAAALAVYRAKHGVYPKQLSDLTPDVQDQLTADPYGSGPFKYRQTDDGYLLYSVGKNGQDEGGSHGDQHIFEGIPLYDLPPSNELRDSPSPNSDDFSIRLPRPPMKPPQPTTADPN
jgi:hypothetical protein